MYDVIDRFVQKVLDLSPVSPRDFENSFLMTSQFPMPVTHPFGLYLICKHSALGRRVYKSDTNLMGVL